MQTSLPIIKTMFSEWYLFTLHNPLYATVLATTVWLLMAIFYSIRIAALKSGKRASEKAGIEHLNALQQQLQHSQEELAASAEQMEKAQRTAQDEAQRALAVEQLIYQRNQQIAGIIQTLATSFDLGERPLLASEDIKADALWQQHDKVITQLIERLRTEQQAKTELQQAYQAETAKLAEKDMLFETLQATLATHANQLSKLEQALEQQKSIIQQQDNAQQVLSDTLKQYQADAIRPAEPEPIETVNIFEQPIQPQEIPDTAEPLIEQPAPGNRFAHINEEPLAAVTWQDEDTQVEFVVSERMPPDIKPEKVVEETPSVISDTTQQPVAPSKGSLGKIKNLFGKKQQPIKTEPQWSVTKADEKEFQPLTSDEEQQSVNPAEVSASTQDKPGKLKGFYSKFKPKGK
ncbi:MAG: hypothetical protein M0Q44_01745 [Methylobacter sp.]|jgi:hypothetical protein|nr:hypothetical protein [Methylobacter sp.]